MDLQKKIHIGTSGWSYKHWKPIYYPGTVRAGDYLSFLSKEFDSTEINTSFYRLPKPATLQKWMAAVPKDFKFCPKMSRYLTQMKKLNEPEEPLDRFFSLFGSMKKHLGPVLIQLPPNLGFHLQKAEYFFSLLKEKYSAYIFALEVRHDSWLQPPVIRLLTRFQITFVIASSGDRFPMAEEITARDIYIRFHGPDGSYATSYPDDVLEEYADKCTNWIHQGHRLWIYFNNDIHGYAIENARTLKKMLSVN